jgi:hypothetical protein
MSEHNLIDVRFLMFPDLYLLSALPSTGNSLAHDLCSGIVGNGRESSPTPLTGAYGGLCQLSHIQELTTKRKSFPLVVISWLS